MTVTGQDLVVVQSVLEAEYWDELQRGLEAAGHQTLRVVLDADPDAIHARIDADPDGVDIRKWRHDHVQTYVDARGWLRDASDLMIDTTLLSVAEMVSAIAASVPRAPSQRVERRWDHVAPDRRQCRPLDA